MELTDYIQKEIKRQLLELELKVNKKLDSKAEKDLILDQAPHDPKIKPKEEDI